VRAGAHTLVRAVPHLPPGVVLAVVDPGVGSSRRGLCLQCKGDHDEPTFFIGPDNGLLVAAAELVGHGSIDQAFELSPQSSKAEPSQTFDGRDLFAPAAAALCRGTPPQHLGQPIEVESLVRLFDGVVEHGRMADGRICLRAEVTWVDHFGNIQLAATLDDARTAGLSFQDTVSVTAVVESDLVSQPDCPITSPRGGQPPLRADLCRSRSR